MRRALVLLAVAALAAGCTSKTPPVAGSPAASAPATSPAPPASPSPSQGPSPAVAAASPSPAGYTTSTATNSGTRSGARYHVTYPVLATGPLAAKITGEIASAVQANVSGLVSTNGPPAANESITADTTSFWHLGPRVVAAWIRYGVDFTGSAHPTESESTLVYDLDDGSPVTLARVFTSEQAGLTALAAYCKPAITQQLGPMALPEFATGSDPTHANYATWVPSPAGMTIIFSEYQVAPYAAGVLQVTVPWDRLPLSPLARAILRS